MDTREITTFIPRLLIRFYQVARPRAVRHCRFYPTCSDYFADALKSKGLRAGLGLGIARLAKCHPWHPGGYDPITF